MITSTFPPSRPSEKPIPNHLRIAPAANPTRTTSLLEEHREALNLAEETLRYCPCPVSRQFVESVCACHTAAIEEIGDQDSVVPFPRSADAGPSTLSGSNRSLKKFRRLLSELESVESSLVTRHRDQLYRDPDSERKNRESGEESLRTRLERNLWGLRQIALSLP